MEIITWACSIKCQVERSKTFPIFFPLLESNSELFKKPGLASIYNIMTLVPWSGSSVARPVSIRGKRRERCWMSLRYFFFFFLPISSLKKKKRNPTGDPVVPFKSEEWGIHADANTQRLTVLRGACNWSRTARGQPRNNLSIPWPNVAREEETRTSTTCHHHLLFLLLLAAIVPCHYYMHCSSLSWRDGKFSDGRPKKKGHKLFGVEKESEKIPMQMSPAKRRGPDTPLYPARLET